MNILNKILAVKHEEITAIYNSGIDKQWMDSPLLLTNNRGWKNALLQPGLSIIAEVKKASPSKGLIRQDFKPLAIASAYQTAGAACLSVLTDEQFFQGSIEYLHAISNNSSIPVLRKDFIIDEIQIVEAKMYGADAILLIAEALTAEQIARLSAFAHTLKLDVLLEVHSESELEKIDFSVNTIIGINNRDLRTFITDVRATQRIAALLPEGVCIVSESGIQSRETVKEVQQAGVHAILVGEHFMRQTDVGAAVTEMRRWADED